MRIDIWHVVEWVTIAAIAVLAIWYTLFFGWWGFVYCVLAAAMGGLVVYYFADIMPILGPLLRRWEKANKGDRK
jgi:hypothetical protein